MMASRLTTFQLVFQLKNGGTTDYLLLLFRGLLLLPLVQSSTIMIIAWTMMGWRRSIPMLESVLKLWSHLFAFYTKQLFFSPVCL